MAKTEFKKSVLKANEKLALNLWAEFQKLNEQTDWKNNGVEFRKRDLTEDENGTKLKKGSFEIRYTKMIDGTRKGKAIFKYLKKDIGSIIFWNEKFVTLPE